MTVEEDFKAKVQELFARVSEHLQQDLDSKILSDCEMLEEHKVYLQDYFVPRAFLCAFLDEERDRISQNRFIFKKDFKRLVKKYHSLSSTSVQHFVQGEKNED